MPDVFTRVKRPHLMPRLRCHGSESLEVELAHNSGGEDEFVAEGGRDGPTGFEQRLQMRLGRLLKAQGGFAAVVSVRVATRQQAGFGDPDAVFVLTELHFRKWNDHDAPTVARLLPGVNGGFHA